MTDDSRQHLQQAVGQYVPGGITEIRELGAGNINATYLVTSDSRPFVLQRINRRVFPDPIVVAENFSLVTRHLEERQRQGDTNCAFARLLPTLEGKPWFADGAGEIWRAQSYLAGRPLLAITRGAQAGETGLALGRFHKLIGSLSVELLQNPLPGFHILPGYLADFDRLADGYGGNRDADLDRCFAIVEQYREMAPLLLEACDKGLLQVRIIHGDPKVDNFLFDTRGERVVGLIDLDTVGPGLLHYDLGDSLRSCCNRGGEGGDPLQVDFDMAACRAFLAGYGREMGDYLSRNDREYLYEAVLLISFELGLRFFSDHLRGNTYFKVRRQGENLQRALVQFALVQRIAEREAEIRRLL